MNKLLLPLFFLFFNVSSHAANIFVDQSAPAGGDGSTWALAFQDIQSAVDAASANDIILIAAGIYQPVDEIDIIIPLTIRGGYPQGGGPQDINVNITQIQGDLLSGVFDVAIDSETLFQGFRLSNFRTGIATDSSIAVDQVEFFGSIINDIRVDDSISALAVTNCLFSDSSGTSISATLDIVNSITISNSIFENSSGRALSADDQVLNIAMVNCSILNSTSDGTSITLRGPNANIINLNAENNNQPTGSILSYNNDNGTLFIKDSNFSNNTGQNAVNLSVLGGSVIIENTNISDNTATGPFPYGVIDARNANVTARNCKFNDNFVQGSQARIFGVRDFGAGISLILDNCEFRNNDAVGSIENLLRIQNIVDLTINNCTFDNNVLESPITILNNASITNNVFENHVLSDFIFELRGQVPQSSVTFERNRFSANTFGRFSISSFSNLESSNNSYTEETVSVFFNITNSKFTNENYRGNSSGRIFFSLLNTNATIENSVFISELNSGSHRLNTSSGDVSLNIVNSTFSASNFNDVNVNVNFNDDLPSTLRNSVLWSGSNLAQSALTGSTSNLVIQHSLVKGENFPGVGNLNGTVVENTPIFVNPNAFDFRMQDCSPTINEGRNSYSNVSTDLLNNLRIFETSIDMGAYELQEPARATCSVPERPLCTTLILPADGDTDVSTDTNLRWTADPDATGYILRVGTTLGSFDLVNETLTGSVTSYNLPSDLPDSAEIFVRIIPFNGIGNAVGCVSESFFTETVPSSCTALTAPLNNTTNVSVDTNLTWNAIPDATGYILRVGTALGSFDLLNITLENRTTYDLPNDLPFNSEIFVRIIPFNEFGNAIGCVSESFTTETLVTEPNCTTISMPLNGDTDVPVTSDLSWNSAVGADGYRVTIGTTSGGTDIFDNINLGINTSVSLPDFPENTEIFVSIVPYNSEGNAIGCAEESFTTETLPTVPGCTSIDNPNDGTNNVPVTTNINWAEIADATGYVLSVGTTPGGAEILDSVNVNNVLTYDFLSDLPENTEIFVTIIPYNDVGFATGCAEESFTTETLATIPNCTALTTPLNGSTNVSILTDLTWTALTNADGYFVTVGTTSGGSDILDNENVTGTTFDLPTDLPENTEIFVTIIPYNGAGNATGCVEESFTTETLATTPDCTELTSPLNGETGVSLETDINWLASATAEGYLLSIGTTPGGTDILNNEDVGNTTNFVPLNDLPESTEIFVTLIPYNAQGNTTGCAEESFTTETLATIPNCTALTSPLNGSTNVPIITDLTWTALANANGYFVTVGTTSGGNDILDNENVTGTTFDLPTDLPENTEIFVTIIPYNGSGNATGCAEESFTTETLATIPNCTALTTPLNGSTNVSILTDLTWTALTNADGYFVTVGTTSGGNDILDNEDVTGTTFNLPTDLPENTEIFVTIIPYNGVGNATGCNEESFTTETLATIPNCTNLVSPLNGATTVSTDLAEITWEAVTNVDGYRITINGSSSDINDVTNLVVAGTSHPFTNNFDNGETVTVTIVPFNDEGDANGCAEESFTMETLVTIPNCTSLVSPLNAATNISITTDFNWTVISNANGYFLTIGTTSGGNDILDNFDVGNNTTYDLPADLPENTEIFVTIIPYNATGDAIGCTEESFTTISSLNIPSCTTLSDPLNNSTGVFVDTNISWDAVNEATGYILSIGTTSGGNDILDNFDARNNTTYNPPSNLPELTTIFVTIIPYNSIGQAVACLEEQFDTNVGFSVPNCTELTNPVNNAVGIETTTDLSWSTVANASGYRITVGTTPTGNEIINDFDVGNLTTYNLPTDLPFNATIYVTITPYNTVGDAIGCSVENFSTVTGEPRPNCTTLSSPLNGETDVALDASINWNPVPNATGYRITVGSVNGGGELANNEDVGNTTTFTFGPGFIESVIYYVTVTPYNAAGDALDCTEESFTTVPPLMSPDCTTLTNPLNLETNVALDVNISWGVANRADGYRLTLGTTSGGNDILDNLDLGNITSYNLPNDLPPNTEIFVSITPYNTAGNALSCSEERFITEDAIIESPSCTVLNLPINGDIDVAPNTLLSWDAVDGVEGYLLHIGTTAGGSEILANNDVGLITTYEPAQDLPQGQVIFVTLIPYNAFGIAESCSTESFTIIAEEEEEDETLYGISPNGDGINDFWSIDGIESSPINTVTIYNRWGDMVFTIDDYDNQSNVFRGEANQKTKMGAGALPSGTYFFNIQIDGETILRKTQGFLVIKR
ncbi:gliding motility-associated C-terminal domain-containing protein [Maribacter sp. R77961]|uniref:T9SS type B sorting domain-containing protein n=1 Tax=Maribacter sp. R77961 TaxID=3093871 RepID=UPI0037CB181E